MMIILLIVLVLIAFFCWPIGPMDSEEDAELLELERRNKELIEKRKKLWKKLWSSEDGIDSNELPLVGKAEVGKKLSEEVEKAYDEETLGKELEETNKGCSPVSVKNHEISIKVGMRKGEAYSNPGQPSANKVRVQRNKEFYWSIKKFKFKSKNFYNNLFRKDRMSSLRKTCENLSKSLPIVLAASTIQHDFADKVCKGYKTVFSKAILEISGHIQVMFQLDEEILTIKLGANSAKAREIRHFFPCRKCAWEILENVLGKVSLPNSSVQVFYLSFFVKGMKTEEALLKDDPKDVWRNLWSMDLKSPLEGLCVRPDPETHFIKKEKILVVHEEEKEEFFEAFRERGELIGRVYEEGEDSPKKELESRTIKKVLRTKLVAEVDHLKIVNSSSRMTNEEVGDLRKDMDEIERIGAKMRKIRIDD